MPGAVERRPLEQRWAVVGIAPEHRAQTAGATKRLQRSRRVRGRSVLVDAQRRLTLRSAFARTGATVGRETELAEQDVRACAEPAGDPREEREQLLVGGTVGPGC